MQAAGHPHNQAVAAALHNARAHPHADGGSDYIPVHKNIVHGALQVAHHVAKHAAGGLNLTGAPGQSAMGDMYQGPIANKGNTPGRVDNTLAEVPSGSYVVPADVQSIMGQGNSDAGHAAIKAMFPMDLAGGIKMPPGQPMKASGVKKPGLNLAPMKPKKAEEPSKHAEGGDTDGQDNGKVPIIWAPGETLIPPESIIGLFGNLDKGHRALDAMVKEVREREIKRLKSAPPPKK